MMGKPDVRRDDIFNECDIKLQSLTGLPESILAYTASIPEVFSLSVSALARISDTAVRNEVLDQVRHFSHGSTVNFIFVNLLPAQLPKN